MMFKSFTFWTLVLALLPFRLAAHPTRYGETLCGEPQYDCREVQKGDSWKSLWEDPYERDAEMRVNRMNVRLRTGMILAVPKKLRRGICARLAPFVSKIDATGDKFVLIDLSKLAWGAYDPNGYLVGWGPASGGKDWCSDIHGRCRTPDGQFRIISEGGVKCKSHTFPIPMGGAPMPYCLFFRPGYALHGSPEVPGYNASHGCVRLFPDDAQWLNRDFVDPPNKKTGALGTRILIRSTSDSPWE